MVLDIALVGTAGAMPLPNRWLSSVLLRYGRRLLLFDCGEGTQISLRALGWGLKDIDLILISHMHGDHTTGLPGLLLTLGSSGRTEPVLVVGPTGLGAILAGLLVVAPYLPFEVRWRELDSGARFELDDLTITCVAAEHRVPCLAYRIDVPRGRRFLPDHARALGVPLVDWKRLQHGEVVGAVSPDDVLGLPRRGLSIGLVTDTRPTDAVAHLVEEVDLLVCEGTYGDDEDHAKAVDHKHMTFREAATLARQARVNQLLLTHFSASMVDPELFGLNARAVFERSIVGHDHLTLSLRFTED